jgi:CBS domain-containing protein
MIDSSYEEIQKQRRQKIKGFSHDHFLLNKFHDDLMLQIVQIALQKIKTETGTLPSPFSFFVMGSAGRSEQGLWSDQDHGIIYEENNDMSRSYFLSLGNEIAKGLHQAGYQYCSGEVMANNPTWCKSQMEWQQQIYSWVQERNWESIRNLLIFIDSRTLYGENNFVHKMKHYAFKLIENNKVLPDIFTNTIHFKKGIGIFGQFLTETHGSYAGQLHLKETTLIPFVNAIRFLAIKEKIIESSTLSRINLLTDRSLHDKEKYKNLFIKLLNYRLLYGNDSNYEASHFLNISKLSKRHKKELKEIIKAASFLFYQNGRNRRGRILWK